MSLTAHTLSATRRVSDEDHSEMWKQECDGETRDRDERLETRRQLTAG